MKQDDWIEACNEIQALEESLKLATQGLTDIATMIDSTTAHVVDGEIAMNPLRNTVRACNDHARYFVQGLNWLAKKLTK